MKLFYILLFLYVLSVNAQRRTTPKSESTEAEPAQRITSRGRTRFSAPHDIPQNEQRSSENTVRRTTRKRIEPVATFERRAPTKSDSINRSYEVEETVEDSPIDSFRRQSKPRVLTETHFEAQNAPKRTLFRPHPTTEKLDVDDLIKNFGSNTVEANPPKTSEFSSSSTTSRTESSGDLTFSEEITTDSQQTDLTKFDEEIRKQTETKSSTSPPTENKRNSNHRRVNVRTRVNTPTETVTTAKTRTRTRVNVNRKPVEAVSSTSSPATHASRIIHRRRGSERSSPENSSRGPSVFSAEETQGSPSRSRTGRRIDNQAPEKITLDLPISTRGRSRTRSQPSSSTTERHYDRNSRRRTSSRFQSNASTSTVKPTTSIRNRSRTRPLLPTVDEKKFEVLPLFESESKIVRPNYHSKEIELSATEDNVHYAKPDNKSNLVSSRVSVSVETRTESSFRRKPYSRKSKVKESIVSEISEVTSKRTVSRRRNNALPITESKVNTRVKVDAPKVTFSQVVTSSRGRKKSEINLNEVKKKKNSLSSSEEEITDSDNYPAAFKALIQAKKSNKESRPSKLPTSVTSEKVVTSSSTEASSTVSTTTVTKSDTIKEDDFDNELIPQSSTTTTQRPIRQRSTTLPRFSEKPKQRQSLPSRNPTKNTFKSTTANPEKHISKEPHRFHAKFTTTGKSDVKVDKIGRTYTPKPPRGIYSSKNKEINIRNRTNKNVIETAAVSTQIPKSGSFKKSNRYSSRYRSDISSRGRSTTSAPAYIPTIPTAAYVPTIPTVTPPIAVKLGEAYKDNDLGLEVITFDDPVNTVPSANLVSGEYYDAQNNSVTVVSKAVTTEKPVSIIERIINSITAISTTSSPELKSQPVTTVTSEPTRGSAILKLATKKPTKLDKTVDETKTVLKQSQTTSTSEKPTTVIERILNSLSAIQANDQSNDIQVGNDFNTISSPSTTPISRITKSATITSLSAPQSTSINPLSVFDEISEEQTLQKRTIGKLLALLNGLTTTVSPRTGKLVVVTPKPSNFLSNNIEVTTASNQGSSSSTNSTTELFTSPIPSVSTESQSPPSLDLQLDQRSSFAVTTESSSQTVTDSAPPTTTTITNTETTVVSTETLGTTPQTTVNINEISSADMTPNPFSRNIPESTTDLTSALGVLSLFVSPRITSNLVESTTPSLSSDFVGTTTETGITDTNTFFTIPSTIPTLTNFEVSPGSVSIYSANDISNSITPDDNIISTITISSKNNFGDTTATTESTTVASSSTESSTESSTSSISQNNTASVNAPEGTTVETATDSNESSSAPMSTTESSTASTDLTTESSTTSADSSGSTTEISPSQNNSMTVNSNQTVSNTTTSMFSNRSGRLLNVIEDPVQNNNIDSTSSSTPDYFIFAVLNNNTILRKRPTTSPSKDAPFLIVGVYPNNTIVRKFPNGTIVPMEPIIRVRGFDTRENPPPLPEITSNQVTNDPGSPSDNTNVQTVDDARNAKSLFVSNPLPAQSGNNATENVNATTEASSTESSSVGNVETTTISTGNTISSTSGSTMVPTPRPTIPTLSELLNGKTLEAFNDIINNSNPSSNEVSSTTANYQTLQVNQEISSTSSIEPDTETPASSTEGPLINTSSIPDITTTLSSSTEGLITTPIYSTTTRLTMTPIETLSQSASTTISSSDISNRILDNSISTTASPSTTTASSTTEVPVTVQPTVTTVRTTTSFPVPTTFFPMLFSTILSTLQPRITTNPPISSFKTTTVPTTETTNLVTAQTEPIPSASTPIASTITPRRGKVAYFDTITTTEEIATTTAIRRIRTTTTTPLPTTRIRTTQAPTTTTTTERPTTRTTETTTNTLFTSANIVARSSTAKPKLKQLTDEQRKNLETLAQLEKEQASILQQLSFLTNLNLGGNKPNNNKATTERSNLANRIIALAMDRDKARTSTPLPNSIQDVLSSTDNRQGKKLSSTSESKSPSLEDVLKQYNVSGLSTNTPSSPLTSTYGKSNDALLAALLKEQGIGPTTPKGLGSIYSETTTTRRPKPTTRAPGRLMQGLNWLLNALAPPTTRKPRTKPRKLTEELLTNQPTHITPVVTAAPTGKVFSPNSLSQEDIGKLIKQLEAIQKDPKKNELDFSQINSLQHLLNNNEGVQIITPPKAGTTSKIAPTKESFFSSTQTERLTTRARIVKSTTASPSTVDNSLDDEEIYTTPRPRMSLPPVRLRPVPGIDENSDPLIRGNLITAAVNVTRAISSFLGSALQGAATSFQSLLGTGSRLVGNYVQGSSAG